MAHAAAATTGSLQLQSERITATAKPATADQITAVAEKIATKVKGVNRVVWDITPKPPATIEWE